jgi:hypothetical protein
MTHREAMRRYFGRSRTVAANWRARELAALRSIENRRRNPSTGNALPRYRADNFDRFMWLDMVHEARRKARAAGWRLPA